MGDLVSLCAIAKKGDFGEPVKRRRMNDIGSIDDDTDEPAWYYFLQYHPSYYLYFLGDVESTCLTDAKLSSIVVLFNECHRQPFSHGNDHIICPVSTAKDLGFHAMV